jgi:biopolymer transport protein ExbD
MSAHDLQTRLRAIRALARARHAVELPLVKSEINVTPLVDVVLVLLIIFMVVTPMIASGVAVDLPRTTHHNRKPDDGKDIIVSVTQAERLYVGGQGIGSPDQLGAALAEERRRFPNKTIFLKADTRVPFGAVRRTLAAMREAGMEEVYVGTEQLEKPGGGP